MKLSLFFLASTCFAQSVGVNTGIGSSGVVQVATPASVAAAQAAATQGGTLKADSFTGADFSVQINACITAVIAAGGGNYQLSGIGGVGPRGGAGVSNSGAAAGGTGGSGFIKITAHFQ